MVTIFYIFQQVKSHLLEISDTLLQLNMSLHKIRSKSKMVNPEQCHLEEKLQKLYEKWRLTHQAVTDVESKHHCYQIEKQQGEFSELLTEKLSRLVRTEEYVKNNSDFNGKSGDKSGGGGGWWRSLVKYSLVTGVVLVSLVSSSYVWSYSKCQHGYYSTIWPLITFTTAGPRPYWRCQQKYSSKLPSRRLVISDHKSSLWKCALLYVQTEINEDVFYRILFILRVFISDVICFFTITW